MSSPVSSPAWPFGDLPVMRRGGRWLLTASAGSVPADRAFAVELDRFAVAMAAADRAVAALPPRSGGR
ncbi:hypothetical protein [Actinacidiphila paucisporea]|uniref:Uncharacterized protein n=1 Tax=Actinacidiphila paucisporea TaxID=310782 RepID=A0A1M7PZA5_9ACTN|nr:hypothetical protein [Actinacidiphila paucisporea]SHN23063.1 hypothetical protein SAMN05216499_12771 [Actinacidiphila paucisporea]